MNQIETIFNQSLEIKKEFQKIETGKWGPKEFGTELIVQTGHLADMILRQSVKDNPYSIEENNKHLGDEISDVLLNTFSIIDACGLSDINLMEGIKKNIDSENSIEDSKKTSIPTSIFLFQNIVKSTYLMFSLTNSPELNTEKILDTAARIVTSSLALGSYMELDLVDYFNKMALESKTFIEQKARKIIESYPYKVPRIEITIEESALPLLERPPQIELSYEKPLPFFLLRASGMPYVDEIRDRIQQEGFKIDHERTIDNFELLARYLYPADPKVEESYLWFLLSRKAFPDTYNQGYAFILSSEMAKNYKKIDAFKRKIRNHIGPTPYKIQYQGKKIFADLHHIHAPDEKDYIREFGFLSALSYRVDHKNN